MFFDSKFLSKNQNLTFSASGRCKEPEPAILKNSKNYPTLVRTRPASKLLIRIHFLREQEKTQRMPETDKRKYHKKPLATHQLCIIGTPLPFRNSNRLQQSSHKSSNSKGLIHNARESCFLKLLFCTRAKSS
jgi:hypothetical protein